MWFQSPRGARRPARRGFARGGGVTHVTRNHAETSNDDVFVVLCFV